MAREHDIEDDDPPVSWRRYVIIIAVLFVIAGAITGPLVFPDVNTIRAVFGGAVFGVFCTFCVLMHRMFE